MGVIGCGPVGSRHARAIWESEVAELTAVCDVSLQTLAPLAQRYGVQTYTDFREMLRQHDLDVVTIATPNHIRLDPALAALEHGCHLFCEKPLAVNAEEALAIVESAEVNGLQATVNYNRRFGFGYRKAQELISAGQLGELRQIALSVSDGLPRPHVARFPEVMLTTLLTHHLDLACWLCGHPVSVFCEMGPAVEGLVRDASLLLRFENGVIGTISGHYQQGQTRTSERCEVIGTEGGLTVLDVTREVVLTSCDPDQTRSFRQNHFEQGDAFYDTLSDHLKDFLQRMALGRPASVSIRDGLTGLRIVELALRSHCQRRPIEV